LRAYSAVKPQPTNQFTVSLHWMFSHNFGKYGVVRYLADRTNGRAIGTVLRLSSVCDVIYCG